MNGRVKLPAGGAQKKRSKLSSGELQKVLSSTEGSVENSGPSASN